MDSTFPGRDGLHGKVMVLAGALLATLHVSAQPLPSPVGAAAPHRYLVAYRNNTLPGIAQSLVRMPGVQAVREHPVFGIAVVQTNAAGEAAAIAALRADPNVEFVVHDRVLAAHALVVRAALPATLGVTVGTAPTAATYDSYYTASPQGWAVIQSGGYGAGVAGGPAHGPWDTTLGTGVRIAILDSGVDAAHPDIAPNLGLSLSEIDQSPLTGVPSACDDGSPQDQQGHGTWVASLAAAAMGPSTGLTIGVAPGATLLNIKVLERLPDPSSTAPDVATQCATGQAGGPAELGDPGHRGRAGRARGHHQPLARYAGRSRQRRRRGPAGRPSTASPTLRPRPARSSSLPPATTASTSPTRATSSFPPKRAASWRSSRPPTRPAPRTSPVGAACAPGPDHPALLLELRRAARRHRRARRQLSGGSGHGHQRMGARRVFQRYPQHGGRAAQRPGA